MFKSVPIRRSACGNKGWNSASFFPLPWPADDDPSMSCDAATTLAGPHAYPAWGRQLGCYRMRCPTRRRSEAQKSNRVLRTGVEFPRRLGRGNGSCPVTVPRGRGLARFHVVRALFATFRIRREADPLPRRVSPLASVRAIEDIV
jgi:hypothetical protein